MDAAAGGGVVFGGRVGRPAWVKLCEIEVIH